MINVTYDLEGLEDSEYYKYPSIEISFEGDQIEFCPETLVDSDEWQNLLDSIEAKQKYCIESLGTNSEYSVSYDDNVLYDNVLNISVSAYGSGCVGSLSANIPLTDYNMDLIRKIRDVAVCVKNNTEYVNPAN